MRNTSRIQKLIKYLNMKNSLFINRSKSSKAKGSIFLLIIALFSFNLNGQNSCINDINDPVFQGCGNKTVTLDEGVCTSKIVPALLATDNCVASNDTFSFNSATSVISAGYGCLMGDVSYFQIFTPGNSPRTTPFSVQSVDLGVFNATNSPVVKVNVYITNGGLNPALWTLIGNGALTVPNTSNGIVQIPVISSAILPSETFAVEVITPTSAVYGSIAGFNNSGQTGITYYKTSSCGTNALSNITNVLGAGYGLELAVNGVSEGVFITPAVGNIYPLDHDFIPGIYNLAYIATDASGNSSSCTFTFTVNGPAGVVSSLSCNDEVQISLDDECSAIVGADEILEGGPYSCYGNYDVVIYNALNKAIGDKLTSDYVGQTLKVSVFDANGNSCWGLIKVQDKSPTPLDCAPVYTTCVGDLRTGISTPTIIDLSGRPYPWSNHTFK